MNFFISILLFAVSTVAFSQTYKITSCRTSEPVSFAHIQNTTTGQSTISNNDGEFNLEASQNDLILITHISYEGLAISGSSLNSACMKDHTEILEEVVVEANSNHKFLMTVIENTKKKLMLPGRLNAYYKEFVKRDEEYTHFCDADLTYFVDEKRNTLKIDGGLHESRAFILPVSAADDGYIDLDLISPIGYRKTMKLYDPKEISRFLSEDAYENYDYEVFKKDGKILVKAKAIDDGEGFFEGDILINEEDSTLASVKFTIPENRKPYTREVNAIVARVKILQNDGYIIYSKTNQNEIYPSFLRISYDLKIWNKKKINQVSSFITDINIYDIPADQSAIDKSLQFNKKSIYKQGTDYQSEYWIDKSLIGLTSEEKEIIENSKNWKSN